MRKRLFIPEPPWTDMPPFSSCPILAYGMLSAICAPALAPEIFATRGAASTMVSQFIFAKAAGRGPL